MTGPSTFAEKWCAGIGIAAHLTDGGLIEMRSPIRVRLCPACWQRFHQTRHARKVYRWERNAAPTPRNGVPENAAKPHGEA